MRMSLLQLNRIACLLADAEDELALVIDSPTHHVDGTVIATVDLRRHIIQRDGTEITEAEYVRDGLGLVGVVA